MLALLPMKLACLLGLLQASAVLSKELPQPTPLERLGRQTNVAAIRAAAAASDARSAADETEARLAAEASMRSKQASKLIASEIAVGTRTVQGAAVEAAKEAARTQMEASQAQNALNAARAGLEAAKASAVAHVQETIDNALTGTYMGLQEWKMKVLHDPTKEATKAGMKAALPYEKALQTIEKRVSDYETRASGLSNQARTLRSVAVGLAGAAVKKQAGGALKAAESDMMNAHIMMNQATHFEAQGLKLITNAQLWNAAIPVYSGAAATAAHQKTWQYAKKLYAPIPFSPGAPPPVPVLLEEAHVEKHAARFLHKSAQSKLSPEQQP